MKKLLITLLFLIPFAMVMAGDPSIDDAKKNVKQRWAKNEPKDKIIGIEMNKGTNDGNPWKADYGYDKANKKLERFNVPFTITVNRGGEEMNCNLDAIYLSTAGGPFKFDGYSAGEMIRKGGGAGKDPLSNSEIENSLFKDLSENTSYPMIQTRFSSDCDVIKPVGKIYDLNIKQKNFADKKDFYEYEYSIDFSVDHSDGYCFCKELSFVTWNKDGEWKFRRDGAKNCYKQKK